MMSGQQKPPRSGMKWTEEEDSQLSANITKKLPIPEIAKIHQRTYTAIKARIIQHAQRAMTDKKLTIQEASSRFGLTIDELSECKPQEKTIITFLPTKTEKSDWSLTNENQMISVLVQTTMNSRDADIVFSYMFNQSIEYVHAKRIQLVRRLLTSGQDITYVTRMMHLSDQDLAELQLA
jgi:hypothetical protein